ncbi:MAG: hypothetical protein E6K84_00195 [Thaumarchaeota archaeon]|nr:MAG: hypothetical protein E6K84_00195 [Nitrososphaerota archaeon]
MKRETRNSGMKSAGGNRKRSRKVAFVAHCPVNQNAKVAEFARLSGVVSPVIDLLKSSGIPCSTRDFPTRLTSMSLSATRGMA